MAAWASLLLIGYAAGRIVTSNPPAWDVSLLASLQGADRGTLTSAVRVVTALGSAVVLDGVFVLAMIILLARRRRRQALFLVLASPGTVVLTQILKSTVGRLRPTGHHLAAAHGASWPSGHASNSLALYGGLLLVGFSLRARSLVPSPAALIAVTGLLTAVVALIGLSRVYLGVHYPTDVLASWILVAAWLATLRHALREPAAPSCLAPGEPDH